MLYCMMTLLKLLKNKIMKTVNIGTGLKVCGLFLLKAFSNYVWTKLTFVLILLFDVNVIGAVPVDHSIMNAICIGIGIFMAFDTTYIIGDKKIRVWTKEFGFNLDEFKDNDSSKQ